MKTKTLTEAQNEPAPMVMTVQQASGYLGLAVSTLNKWRCHGGGPVFIKMGRAVRYRAEDLDLYLLGARKVSTADNLMISKHY